MWAYHGSSEFNLLALPYILLTCVDLALIAVSAILDLVTQSYDPKKDDPFVISPSRVDLTKVEATTYYGSKSKVLSLKTPTGTKCLINFVVGAVISCNIHNAAPFRGNKSVKQILLVPLRGEWERALSLYGMAFGASSVGINTYSILLADNERLNGLSLRTIPIGGESQSTRRALPGMGFMPRKAAAKPQGEKLTGGSSASGRSLLKMRDKTAWAATDKIPLWDGREYFKKNKLASNKFKHELVHTLPSFKMDLSFGDIALVYYSVSNFGSGKSEAHTVADESLSLNLYGVVLIAEVSHT
ncbi:hypothetical protein LXA43DRAFT_893025 [Ganoderma leucocontextum]|nr:hypothetical protein LXA43DRAFT_893025 [Ganoderma leucocontextum]